MARSAMYRKLDRFCRIVLPSELRQGLDLKGGTELEFRVEGDTLVVTRRLGGCSFCGGATRLRGYRDRTICAPCRDSLRMRMARRAASAIASSDGRRLPPTAYPGRGRGAASPP